MALNPTPSLDRWLIIDDDVVFCRILKKSLDKLAYEVTTAQDTTAALDAAQRLMPHYIILDLNIGQENGIDLI